MPPGHIQNRSIVDFAKTLEQRTNGAVKITIYEATLGAPTDQWDMVKTNTDPVCLFAVTDIMRVVCRFFLWLVFLLNSLI